MGHLFQIATQRGAIYHEPCKKSIKYVNKRNCYYKKEPNVSKTMRLIITKEQNKLIANFVKSENLIPLTYKLV